MRIGTAAIFSAVIGLYSHRRTGIFGTYFRRAESDEYAYFSGKKKQHTLNGTARFRGSQSVRSESGE